MDISTIEIEPIQRSDIDTAACLIAEAFRDEPGVVAIMRNNPQRREEILRRHHTNQLMRLNLPQAASRCVFINGQMVGAMVITAPGDETITATGMITFLFKMMFHVTPAIMWRGLMGALDDENHRPEQPNYYLETIAVDPKHQGSGIGGAMMSYVTDIADREGVLTYLSTTEPKTLAFYERHGFRIVSETDQSGAPNYHMLREPKRPKGPEQK